MKKALIIIVSNLVIGLSYQIALADSFTKVNIQGYIRTLDSLLSANQYDSANNLLEYIHNSFPINLTYELELLGKKQKILYEKGSFYESINIGKQYLKEVAEGEVLPSIYLTIGNSYFRLEEYGLALDYYLKAEKIYNEKNDEANLSFIQVFLGLIYYQINDFDNALVQYQNSLQYQIKNNIDHGHNLYIDLGRVYIQKKMFNKAETYLDSAQVLAIKKNNLGEIAYLERNYGWLFREKKEYAISLIHYQEALALHVKENNADGILILTGLLGELYTIMGQHENVLSLCNKNIFLAEKTKNILQLQKLIDLSYQSYISLGEYRSAIELKTRYQHVSDSIQSQKNKSEILLIRLRAEAAVENDLLKKQEEVNLETIRSQNFLLTAIVVVLILLVIVTIIIYRAFKINKNLSAKNKKQSEYLKQLDEAKSRFFANISHDLRSPLTLIMGGIDSVLNNSEVYLSSQAELQLKTALRNGERIIHLTNEINELIKLEDNKLKIEKKYINIDHMLKLFVSLFHSMGEMHNISIQYSKTIFDELPIVSIDPYHFEKVLFNLITNSFKHSNEGGAITVNLDLKNQDQLQIIILDTGEGISEESVPYIFERYYQSPEKGFKAHEGFGLGLAMVKEIIDKHEAKIEVKSKLNVGTQFIITIELQVVDPSYVTSWEDFQYSDEKRMLFEEIEEIIPENKPVIDLDSITKKDLPKVLIVDDHPEIRQYIKDIINPYYHVMSAENGQRALKLLETKKVDLVITDLMMPFIDGFELLERFKNDENLSNIPVLVLSARTSEEDKAKVLSKGVNDFLCKPFNTKELLSRINNLLIKKTKWDKNNLQSISLNDNQLIGEIEKSLLEKVERKIIANIDDPNLSVKDLADEIAMSERKFYRIIKKMTNITPFEYIKEVRLQYVKKLLTEKKLSNSSEAAKMIGMNNVSHFNSQFKKRFGKKLSDILN